MGQTIGRTALVTVCTAHALKLFHLTSGHLKILGFCRVTDMITNESDRKKGQDIIKLQLLSTYKSIKLHEVYAYEQLQPII